jgi:hypothetical protein
MDSFAWAHKKQQQKQEEEEGRDGFDRLFQTEKEDDDEHTLSSLC